MNYINIEIFIVYKNNFIKKRNPMEMITFVLNFSTLEIA